MEMTPSREKYVAYKMIEKWLAQGIAPNAISRKWNQGNTGPCRKGVNKYNVEYDSCAYEQKVMAFLR